MIISSGQMKVLKNKNNKNVKLFGEVQEGDILEVRVNLNVHVTRRVSDKLITVHNVTQNTSRTDAPIYLQAGLEKMTFEPVQQENEAEYQRGYSEAVEVLKDAYIGGYIEEILEGEEE